jgi:hypothetical protein
MGPLDRPRSGQAMSACQAYGGTAARGGHQSMPLPHHPGVALAHSCAWTCRSAGVQSNGDTPDVCGSPAAQ